MKGTLGVIAGVVLGLAFLSVGAFLYPTGRVIQGVYLGEQDISRYDKDELAHIIESEADKGPTHMIVKWQTGKETKVALTDLGIRPNVKKTMDTIMSYGYEPTVAEYINSRWHALIAPVSMAIVYDVNVPALESVLQTYNQEIMKNGHDAYVTVEDDKVVLHKEVPGQRLDIAKTVANLQAQLAKGDITSMSLVISDQEQPKLTVDDLKGIDAILGTYSTRMSLGDTSRTNNIKLATDKINNVIIQPHQRFSFNAIVGERTAEAGYDDAPVFMDGKLVPGIGGGICQVSSTLFNTALLAGMTIEERVPHYAPVGYIPAGRDATVAYGYIDFAFTNPYEHPIYVIAYIEGDTLTISILGFAVDEPTDRSVVVDGETAIPHKTKVIIDPTLKKEEIKHAGYDGLSVNTTVALTYKDGHMKHDSFNSTYDPETTIVVKPTKEVLPKTIESQQTKKATKKEEPHKSSKSD